MKKYIRKEKPVSNITVEVQVKPETQSEIQTQPEYFKRMDLCAAGIDVGATSHFVAVPKNCSKEPVREFKSFTQDSIAMADWLKECGVQSIAMESTGVYWIPLYELLEQRGFEVNLVDARQVKNLPGRSKTDVLDCQWIQKLHSFGLLNSAFRPSEQICELRTYVRQRSTLIQDSARQMLHMQKALTQMNVKLQQVVSDIGGLTGMKIIRAIVNGERDSRVLAQYRDPRCKQSLSTIESALVGNYRLEHLFSLKQALEIYDFYTQKIKDCDLAIEKKLLEFSASVMQAEKATAPVKKKLAKNSPDFDLRQQMIRITGVDLSEVPGISSLTTLVLIGEIGLDMTRWKDASHFASWMGLSPGNKISGGKHLSSKTKASANRAAAALRMAASTLYHSQTALGAYLRRLKSRLGAPKAITAAAHKLAKIIYHMLRYGTRFKEMGQEYYEQQYKDRLLRNLKKKAEFLGFDLVEKVAIAS
jgi:transposase